VRNSKENADYNDDRDDISIVFIVDVFGVAVVPGSLSTSHTMILRPSIHFVLATNAIATNMSKFGVVWF
jgi:hypothetical protein